MKKILSIVLTTAMLFSAVLPAFASAPLRSSAVEVSFDSSNVTVNPGNSAALTLLVEGLGTDPANNQISTITVSSSDSSVSAPSSCLPESGTATGTGISYEISASTVDPCVADITATVTDTDGNSYSCSCFVTVRGLIAQQKDITLEVGESCIVFANRYGFTESEASRNLTWSKQGADTGWISIGEHGTGRQKEAYYIKGIREGTGVLTVSLSSSTFSDSINVEVVSKKAVSIEENGVEVTSAIDLTSVSSVSLDAVCEGFTDPVITWESSHPALVSVSQTGSSAVISRVSYSDTVVAVKATASENGITRTKTVYVNVTDASLRITSSKLENGNITINQGDTVTLSARTTGLDNTATIWTATTDAGRTPVLLGNTVGNNITVTGRLATSSPVTLTARNGAYTDTVNISVEPCTEKSVKITSPDLGSDGFMFLAPGDTSSISAELNGLSGASVSSWSWSASNAPNSENTSSGPTSLVSFDNSSAQSTVIEAGTSASLDFAKVKLTVTADGVVYTDEILVKVNDCNIIDSARYVRMGTNSSVTLSTTNGIPADWYSNSQKTYFGNRSAKPTNETGARATVKSVNATTNPSRITATQNGDTDSVYVLVQNTSWNSVSYDLNGGYGTTPDTVVMSSSDSDQSVILPQPDAAYPSDNGEYVFYGWSEKANAAEPNANALIYSPGEEYSVPSGKSAVTLYAIWAKKTGNVLFTLRLTGDIGAEPEGHPISEYATSCVYKEDAIEPVGFYFNANGVDSRLKIIPSDAEIARAIGIQFVNGEPMSYNPKTDRIIWYVIKRVTDDAAGESNWHVDGVLIKDNKVSITYDKNINVANLSNFPNPPCMFYNPNDTVPIISNVPTCGKTVFVGWNSRPDGRGQWYTSTGSLYNGHTTSDPVYSSLDIEEDTTLYAIWEGILYYDINEDGAEDFGDIEFIIDASQGLIDSSDHRLNKADLDHDGVVDGFDAAELDRILFNHNNPTGDVNQDGTVDSNDYAMLKAYVLCQTDLLDKSNLTGEYDAIKDNYEDRVIITQKYYCADYDHDKSVDGIDLFYLDNRINNLI